MRVQRAGRSDSSHSRYSFHSPSCLPFSVSQIGYTKWRRWKCPFYQGYQLKSSWEPPYYYFCDSFMPELIRCELQQRQCPGLSVNPRGYQGVHVSEPCFLCESCCCTNLLLRHKITDQLLLEISTSRCPRYNYLKKLRLHGTPNTCALRHHSFRNAMTKGNGPQSPKYSSKASSWEGATSWCRCTNLGNWRLCWKKPSFGNDRWKTRFTGNITKVLHVTTVAPSLLYDYHATWYHFMPIYDAALHNAGDWSD